MVITKASMEGNNEAPKAEVIPVGQPTEQEFHEATMGGSLKRIAKWVHQIAKSKGWHIHDRSFGDIIALVHTELTEAFEEYRSGHRPTEVRIGEKIYAEPDNGDWDEMALVAREGLKPEGLGIELADAVIRILDYAEEVGLDMDELIRVKTIFNRTRPYRHGGKVV